MRHILGLLSLSVVSCGGFLVVPPVDGGLTDASVATADGNSNDDLSVATDAQIDAAAQTAWHDIPFSPSVGRINGIWERGQGEVYLVGSGGNILRSQDDGAHFSTLSSGVTSALNAIWGNADEIFAVGDSGVILHTTDALIWTNVYANVGLDASIPPDLFGVSGDASSVYVVGGPNTILQTSNHGQSFAVSRPGNAIEFRAVWSNGTDRYAVGIDQGSTFPKPVIFYSNGGDFTAQSVPSSLGSSGLYAVWGAGNDVFAVGGWASLTWIVHSSNHGQTWVAQTAQVTDETIYGVWGSSANDVYLAGGDGDILHSSDFGANWSTVYTSSGGLYCIHGSGAADIFAGGYEINGANSKTTLNHYGP